jgi:hypothetical protein
MKPVRRVIPGYGRCDKCGRLVRRPIVHAGRRLGPTCARHAGYVPPAREKSAKAPKRTAMRPIRRGRADQSAQGDLFAGAAA